MNAVAREISTETSTLIGFPSPAPEDPNKPSVLFVDDDQMALDELRDISEIEGWNAIVVDNIEAALDVLDANEQINIIVTDIHFANPGEETTNGIQFVSRAKARFHDRDLRYIVLSGDPDSLESSVQEEAVAFLSKPLNPDALVLEVTSALSADRKPLYWRLGVANLCKGAAS